ncbi:MAG TPA: hypothetical protein VM686_39620 [Polyangiaceae bacterium]|nr:hypothetical protein [Polyangiaceae bacterium]
MTTPRSYSVLFWLLALVLLALFVGFRDLPMVDLPQHASQIVIRFREPRRLPCMPLGAEWNPAAFDPRREAADYDYFLVRSDVDRSRQLFESSPERIELELRVGPWWAYRRAGAIAGHF